MKLKNYIFKKNKKYKFRLLKLNYSFFEIFDISKIKNAGYSNFVEKFKKPLHTIKKENLANFIFLLRVLDFRLWEYEKNWFFQKEKGFFGLLERLKILFNNFDLNRLKFKIFKEIISPQEKESLAKLRYKLFKESWFWLKKNYAGNFDNYFKKNKNPLQFCKNLFSLRKFRDFSENFYFLKPNQLLYYEYLLGKNLEKKFLRNLKELTIFADYKICQFFLNLNAIEISSKNLMKIKLKKFFTENSLLIKEIRWASIILGEKLSQKLKIPSFELDTILWNWTKTNKFKIPYPRVRSIFY